MPSADFFIQSFVILNIFIFLMLTNVGYSFLSLGSCHDNQLGISAYNLPP